MTKWDRRNMIKALGMAAALPLMPTNAKAGNDMSLQLPDTQKSDKLKKPISAIIIGAGSRGWLAYGQYAASHQDEIKIVGVAEPIPYRRERVAKTFNIPKDRQFTTWEHVFEQAKFADALIIATPDHLHYGPAMAGLNQGYDMLLEKAIAQTWEECNDILELAVEKNAIVAICHVLRYTPYFRKMKQIIDSGEIGDVVSVQHLEPVARIHMSHSFVRGNWGNSQKSTPMILSKSCHDTDILRWLIGKSCKRVSSFGSLSLFKERNAPKGSTSRCTDGCAVERNCPFSAIKIYKEWRNWGQHFNFDLRSASDETILNELRTGPYGRCVYRCDNNVVDHQVSNFEFEDDVTLSFSMEAHTHYGHRRTRIFGTMGDVYGDMNELVHYNAITRKKRTWDASKLSVDENAAFHGHGGGDYWLMYDFVRAVAYQDPKRLTSTIQASMESHLMGFMAEESRLKNGQVMDVNLKVR
ncbi:Gfo/Idh/MocA family oxidoreductase [Carboxylicivirga mesophila]|uniref:Gfo/Idh/MocA family oxidoreductase n=1 Tax=Carboxylicivirga mesophila TaxID=1166478 RepID=A0ABS5KEC0_9BACT|nr:Gfo/Idh/MocA family oxidoreductase [Carboxylicivirga mesophila]MBS2212673.1 Gfo/Idh/MocA family oxidoreductase [Carboxylicivirga mesophila]